MLKRYLVLLLIFFSFQKMQSQSWKLVWSDEFSADAINLSNWNFETGAGGWGNNELQYYTSRSENASVSNGNLQIVAKQESYNGSNYTSARITTKAKQFIRYGKIEARVKLPEQQGLWPAFWMLGENISEVGWPQCGEIDILEHVNKEANINGTIHWDNGGHAQYGTSTACDVSQFHVYTIEWDSTSIRWLLDSTEYWNATIENNINSTDEFHLPFFAIINMAVGGSWPGNPDGTSVFPDTMFVDYVRFYKIDTDPVPTISPTITAIGSTTFCQGDSVLLTSSMATSYLWSTSATTQSIQVKSGGTYFLSITDSLGGTATSDSIEIIVNALPSTPTITENGVPTNSQLLSSSVTGNQWYVEDSILQDEIFATYAVSENGTYKVMVTDTNGCSSFSDPYTWMDATVPPADPEQPVITANGSTTFCQGDSVLLTSSLATSYLWSTSASTQSIQVKSGGSYFLSINDSIGGTATSDSIEIIVNALPSTPTITENGVPANPQLLSSSVTGNQWYVEDSVLQDETLATYAVSQNGTYKVLVTDSNGCSSFSDPYTWMDATVPPANPEQPVITANDSTTFCQGDSVLLTSSMATSYLWSTSATTQSILVKSGGTYFLSITDSLGGAATSDSVEIKVKTLPLQPGISLMGNVLSSSVTENNQWLQDGVLLDGETNQNFQPSQSGSYAVRVYNSDSCSTVSEAFYYSIVEIHELSNPDFIEIIPNPCNGTFDLKMNGMEAIATIQIYSLLGKLIFESKSSGEKINLSNRPSGIYLIKVQFAKESFLKKLIIQ